MSNRKIFVLHQHVTEHAPNEELDVLKEAAFVRDALRDLGYEAHTLVFGDDPADCIARLQEEAPILVFNKVDTYRGTARRMHLAPAMLEILGIPYTGCSSEVMACTNNKLWSKHVLQNRGLPVAACFTGSDQDAHAYYIVKSVWEHGSHGLTQENVVKTADVAALIHKRTQAYGGQWFAETFIEGRDISVVLIEEAGRAVPVTFEICLEEDVNNPWKIQDYSLKYDYTIPEEYSGRVSNQFDAKSAPIVQKLHDISAQCWEVFGLRHFARIDFRIDQNGNPHILEINATPCLLPETGMMQFGGKNYTDVVHKIIQNVFSPVCA